MDDRREKRPPCVGCKHLDELPGFPGTGYCKQGREQRAVNVMRGTKPKRLWAGRA